MSAKPCLHPYGYEKISTKLRCSLGWIPKISITNLFKRAGVWAKKMMYRDAKKVLGQPINSQSAFEKLNKALDDVGF